MTADVMYYADQMRQQQVEILENVPLARDTFRVRFRCPAIAERIVPGQFVMLRLAGCDDPLIGRPLALFDTVASGAEQGRAQAAAIDAIDVVYLVKGKFTTRLARLQGGQLLDVWGPLGNGFPALQTEHLILVAGGIGQTPMLALGSEYLGRRQYGHSPRAARAERVTLCYGARSAGYLAGLAEFERAGLELHVATDDGSQGHHGLVTQLLEQQLARRRGSAVVMCCGPEPMLAAVAERCAAAEVPCYVSLETPMACGIGICFTCVTRVRQPDGTWDYRRTCVEGPVFASEQIVWE